MVQLNALRDANVKLVNSQPLVAVFVGGTSGIGEFTVRALVGTHSAKGNGLCIYIVGRNAQAAKTIISDCTAQCPDGQYHFIQAKDLSLLQNVDKAAAEVIQHQQEKILNDRVPRVDMLFMSQGGLYFGPREDTSEGLDLAMSMHYYSRALFTFQLLPLLLSSTLPAHVVSVFAAGTEAKLISDDLSLRKPGNFTFVNCRSHCTFMTTEFMQQLASQNPGKLSVVNMFPGLVITPGFDNPDYPLWFKVVWRIASPLAKLMAVAPEEAGQRVLFMATDRFPAKSTGQSEYSSTTVATGTDGIVGGGAYACKNDGESTSESARAKAYKDVKREELSKTVWEHTMKVFNATAAGEVFAE